MDGRQIISISKDILKFSRQVLQKIEGRNSSQYEMCIIYCFLRAIENFESIILLTENNKPIDAGALVRVLIENLCQMKYMQIKPEERSGKFVKYDTLLAHSLRDKMIRNSRYREDKEKIIDELRMLKDDVSKIKRLYPRPELGWHQKNMEDLMNEIQLSDKYLVYWTLNHNIHSGPTTIKKYINKKDGLDTSYLGGSTDFFFMILDFIDDVFALSINNEIENLYFRLNK
ncbi:MAG: hypothetical protein GF383_16255 [Candidatus Lokiarchaeota archaeon]|nr:hypothetical protein [Candidatus Lokiarchaeota archaeon]